MIDFDEICENIMTRECCMSFENLNSLKLSIGIVGAGPAGSMLAYRLAKKGHIVHLLERKKLIERKVCGEYLCPKGVELLENLNLLDSLCLGFESLQGMILVSPNDDIIPTYFPQITGHERGISLNRKIFDQRLLDLALENGASITNDVTVKSAVQLENKKWQVSTDKENYIFDLIIAADGRQSKIGHSLGHIKQINTKRTALHCYLPRKIDHGQRLGEMHILKDNSYCGLDPVSDDEVNFSIVIDSEKLKNSKPKDIINQSIGQSKRLSRMFDLVSNPDDIRIVSTLKNKNDFIAGNNLAYVGDAAGFIDPLTGEGIYNALLSSSLLADCLDQNSNLETALQNYKKRKLALSFQKNVLNNIFQFLIRSPILIKMTVWFLKKSQNRANHFIGIIGNIYDPLTGFKKMLRA
jgi:flavin-dependent dehydrogenase